MKTATKGNSETIAFIQEAVKPTSASVSFISVNFDRLCGNPANSNFRDFEEHHLIWLFRLCLEEIFSIRSLQSSKLRRGMFSSISCKSGLVSISSSQLTDWFSNPSTLTLDTTLVDGNTELKVWTVLKTFSLKNSTWPFDQTSGSKSSVQNLQNSNLRRQLSLKKSTLISLIKLSSYHNQSTDCIGNQRFQFKHSDL